jgi:hypothetical protein
MNVNDLADRLEQFYQGTHIDKAAETLRQQAQNTMHLLLEINRLKAEILVKDTEIETLKSGMTTFKEFAIGKFVLRFYKTDHVWTCTATEEMLDEVKKELALQKLSDIGQEIEQTELQALVKSFFEDYLNHQEETDEGRVFNPIHVSCTRAMMIEPLAKLLMRMKELSGVKE